MSLSEELLDLIGRHGSELAETPWQLESDRWAELVFCILSEFTNDDSVTARALTSHLQQLRLLEPMLLSGATSLSDEHRGIIEYVLMRGGLGKHEASGAVTVLARVARVVMEKFRGKFQRYLRTKGQEIREELVELFSGTGLNDDQLRTAITHWLQNAVGLPLSMDTAHVQKFRRDHRIDQGELESAADELDINLVSVDDLLRLHALTRLQGDVVP